tara:strand:+ start:13743 stop:14369 length:627 start_codon:yes stop_codon:yes gene_type:complete
MDSISSSTKFIASDNNNKNYMIFILLTLLILSLLGVNLFIIVGNAIQVIINIFKPLVSQILAIFGYTAGTVINKTADLTSDVARAGVDIAEGTVQSVGNLLKDASKGAVNLKTKKELDVVISEPKADKSESPIQNGSTMKSSWCLIGEQNGRRGCVEVNDASKCMSGQVFPNAEMCLNPTQTSNMPPKVQTQQHPLKSIKSNPDRSTW